MDIEVIVGGRQSGKTTAMLKWLRKAPKGEHRVLVSHSHDEAMRLYRLTFDEDDNPTDLESWQFVGWQEVSPQAWRGVLRGRGGHIVLGIDNLDLILGNMFGRPVSMVTMTARTTQLLHGGKTLHGHA